MKAFVSWSGGKDSAFACYKAGQKGSIEVVSLLNMVAEDGKNSHWHAIPVELVNLQARAMDISIVQKKTSRANYETEFKKVLNSFKERNINIGIFGDIDLEVHRQWVEKVCKAEGISPVFPLWEGDRQELLDEFIRVGFESVIIVIKKEKMGQQWLGRQINNKFVDDLKALGGVDLCGEAGEYHSFVTAGPIFKKKIKISKTEKIHKDSASFLRILGYEMV